MKVLYVCSALNVNICDQKLVLIFTVNILFNSIFALLMSEEWRLLDEVEFRMEMNAAVRKEDRNHQIVNDLHDLHDLRCSHQVLLLGK